MLKPKQKAYLKSLANSLKPIFQIGKEGISDDMIDSIINHLIKNELMKVSILQNSIVSMDEAETAFSSAGIEVVQKIGRTLILYMHSEKAKNPIILP